MSDLAFGHRTTSRTSVAGVAGAEATRQPVVALVEPGAEIARTHCAGGWRALTEAAPVLMGYGRDIAIRCGQARGSVRYCVGLRTVG